MISCLYKLNQLLLLLKVSLLFSDRLKIEGSNVLNMDIPATNGVIQVVESIVETGHNANALSQ
jgi:hypothetical protein